MIEQFTLDIFKENKEKYIAVFRKKDCLPCKINRPIVAKMVEEGFKFFVCDVEEDPETAKVFQANDLPTFISFENGQPKAMCSGEINREQLIRMLNI